MIYTKYRIIEQPINIKGKLEDQYIVERSLIPGFLFWLFWFGYEKYEPFVSSGEIVCFSDLEKAEEYIKKLKNK